MTLGELLRIARGDDAISGNVVGDCMLCGRTTKCGLRARDVVSDNFSGWNRLFAGDCFCPDCAYLFSDQVFRKKSWVASPAGFHVLSRDGKDGPAILAALLEPPEPPFFVYVARVGHRQGWLSCLHRVAASRDRYDFACEDYDVPVRFERAKALNYLDGIRAARELGATKAELRTACFRAHTWRKAIEAGKADLLRSLARRAGDMLWEVLVYVSD